MAILRLENSTTHSELSDITRELAALNIELKYSPVGKKLELAGLLEKDTLSHLEKTQVLGAVSSHFEEVKRSAGCVWRDLMLLHPGSPNLYPLIASCDRPHTHTDSEALYILDGEGIFGFVRPDGSQVELLVRAGEYINIPAGTEHWFCPAASLQIKAVRYFTTAEGWVPQYTGTQISFR